MGRSHTIIKIGNVELSPNDLDFSKGKIRITTMIDAAIYKALKTEAKASGKKYQSILNEILLDHYFRSEKHSLTKAWENELGRIKKRLAALEKERSA